MANHRGRPPIKSGEVSVPMNVRFPLSACERIWRCAAAEGISPSEYVRKQLGPRVTETNTASEDETERFIQVLIDKCADLWA
jgi:predicted HicB family RNase H-like nuclease